MSQRLTNAKQWLIGKFAMWSTNKTFSNVASATGKVFVNFWSALLYIVLVTIVYYGVTAIYGADVIFLRVLQIKDLAQVAICIVLIRFLWSVIRNK